MLCPNCKTELKMSERQGVEVDYCPQCRGIWLDRGELDKILERSTGEDNSGFGYDSNFRYDSDDKRYDRDYGRHKRKKSFLSDLFDFD